MKIQLTIDLDSRVPLAFDTPADGREVLSFLRTEWEGFDVEDDAVSLYIHTVEGTVLAE